MPKLIMKHTPTPQEVAKFLDELYDKPFGGKERARMKISRASLRELSNRRRLEDSFLKQLSEAAFENGLIIVDLDDYFGVVRAHTMGRYRSVTKTVVNEFLAEKSVEGG